MQNAPFPLSGAVDIGGTKIKVGIVDRQGKVIWQTTFATPNGKRSPQIAMQRIVSEMNAACCRLNLKPGSLQGIGVICAGPVNQVTQAVENPYTLPGWQGVPLPDRLCALSGLPVRMEHDVNGALLGEVFLNRWYDQRVMMVSIGTGIGVAVCDQGRPFTAGRCYHPEMGHIVVDSSIKTICYCGRSGCFESLCSGSALNRIAKAHGREDFDALYHDWQNGDKALNEVLELIFRHFVDGMWNLSVVFKPDILVLGGGMVQRYYATCRHLLLPLFKQAPDFIENIELRSARFDCDSALVGASRLIFDAPEDQKRQNA